MGARGCLPLICIGLTASFGLRSASRYVAIPLISNGADNEIRITLTPASVFPDFSNPSRSRRERIGCAFSRRKRARERGSLDNSLDKIDLVRARQRQILGNLQNARSPLVSKQKAWEEC